MRVLELHAAAIGTPDMAGGDAALDRIAADELRDLGLRARARVVEGAAALVLIEADAPAVAMRPGLAAAPQPRRLTTSRAGGTAIKCRGDLKPTGLRPR